MLDIKYIAGIFDGEGTVGVYKATNGKSDKIYHGVTLIISMSYHPIIKEIYKTLKYGNVGTQKPKNKKNKLCLRLMLGSKKDVLCFLTSILPYLHEKKEQAKIAIAYCNNSMSGFTADKKLKQLKKIEYPILIKNKNVNNKLSPEYMAGLFDGEGSVGVYKIKEKRYGHGEKNPKIYYGIKLSITGAFLPTLQNIQETIKIGSIQSQKRKRGPYDYDGKFGKKCKRSWRWMLHSKMMFSHFLI